MPMRHMDDANFTEELTCVDRKYGDDAGRAREANTCLRRASPPQVMRSSARHNPESRHYEAMGPRAYLDHVRQHSVGGGVILDYEVNCVDHRQKLQE